MKTLDSKVTGAMTMTVMNQLLNQSIERGTTSQNERGAPARLAKKSNTKAYPKSATQPT